MKLNKNLIKTFKKISKSLSGAEKRLFIAEHFWKEMQDKQKKYLDGTEELFHSGSKKSLMALSVMWIFMSEEINQLKKKKNLAKDIKDLKVTVNHTAHLNIRW